MDEKTRRILHIASGDLPLSPLPYDEWARAVGVEPEEFIFTLRSSARNGIVRRFGAVLAHAKSGMKTNAMVAWEVPDDRADFIGEIMARFDAVSHCYRRDPPSDFPYRLFTMIHAPDERTLSAVINAIQTETGLNSYAVFGSVREFKKTSPDYLGEE
jgi:DNA-binding Lrp family transcriptional regulator